MWINRGKTYLVQSINLDFLALSLSLRFPFCICFQFDSLQPAGICDTTIISLNLTTQNNFLQFLIQLYETPNRICYGEKLFPIIWHKPYKRHVQISQNYNNHKW